MKQRQVNLRQNIVSSMNLQLVALIELQHHACHIPIASFVELSIPSPRLIIE